MDKAKYIVFDGTEAALPDFPVLFPCFLQHDTVANKFQGLKVLGAGTVEMTGACDNLIVFCDGRSVSLDIDSRGEKDAVLIKKHFGRH